MSGHDDRVWLRLRTQRFGLRTDTPIRDLNETDAQLLWHSDVSKAVVCRGARTLPSQHVQLTTRGLKILHMRKATESPLRFASVCFPPCFPGFRARGGEAETIPRTVLRH